MDAANPIHAHVLLENLICRIEPIEKGGKAYYKLQGNITIEEIRVLSKACSILEILSKYQGKAEVTW